MRWIIDGNNVYGSRPDGWWNDREGAAARFAQEVADWCWTLEGDDVVLVFDPPIRPSTRRLAGGNLAIEVATHSGRNAADDLIVDLVTETPDDWLVVTSDRGLLERLPDGMATMGAGRFLDQIGARSGRSRPTRGRKRSRTRA